MWKKSVSEERHPLMFNEQTVKVKAVIPDADWNSSYSHTVAVTITVPKTMPIEDLKEVMANATGWCQKMAEALSKVLWENSDRKE
jgi:hypothetical protein